MNKTIALFSTAACCVLTLCACVADGADYRYWPTQRVPKGLASTHYELFKPIAAPNGKTAAADLGPEHMLAQSLAGLIGLLG